jgi:hypothetical protein
VPKRNQFGAEVNRDPLVLFTPGKATFPCDMGAPIPFRKVPMGCAEFASSAIFEVVRFKYFSKVSISEFS